MTVDELIMLLETLPGDLPVHADANGYDVEYCPRVRSARITTLVHLHGDTYKEASAADAPDHGLPQRRSVLLGYEREP